MTASMWQVLKTRDILNYWKVAEFVSVVMDMVPELLMYKHRAQLNLGLRARYILELCRSDELVENDILSHLDKIKSQHPTQGNMEEEEVAVKFLELIQTLLKDPQERREFFSEVFPAEYGALYDSDLQTLFWEFVCRLAQLLPVPDLTQTASWLGAECSVLEDCVQVAKTTEQPDQSDSPQGLSDQTHTVSFVDDVAVEIITVTDYAEVELGTSTDIEVVMGGHCYEGTDGSMVAEGSLEVLPVEMTKEDEVGEAGVETFLSLSARTEHKQTHMQDGVYSCKQCYRKFTWELALAKHLKTHMDGHGANEPTETETDEQEFVISDENVCEDAVEVVKPDCQMGAEDNSDEDPEAAEVQSESGGLLPGLNNQHISTKVRTSGRKRKPTMKIQVINLQKHMATKRKKTSQVDPPALKPLPLSCSAEHSYGSSMVLSKDSDGSSAVEVSSAAFSCPMCSFHHSDEVQVQQHIDSVHSEAEEDNLSLQPLTDEEGRFTCPDCDKSFRFQSLLKAHQRIHTGEQPFLCSQCGRRFSFKQSLERHKQTHKTGRKYECLICGEFFKSLLAQREHKSSHMENGEYLCSECGRAFAWKSALVRHLKTHTEDADKAERSYKCPHCELGFSCASYLNRHLQTHQEERVHSCNCGKSFAYRAALTAHQRIHQKDVHTHAHSAARDSSTRAVF
ncbi:hypothetical protein INR49_021848 [Caranx melampygus]|nr:hypothetical protein INR49_021848 [Caranx melampygus]